MFMDKSLGIKIPILPNLFHSYYRATFHYFVEYLNKIISPISQYKNHEKILIKLYTKWRIKCY